MDWPSIEVETVGQIKPAIPAVVPGVYHIDEITCDPRRLVAFRAVGVSASSRSTARL
jgi:hypothetical protein